MEFAGPNDGKYPTVPGPLADRDDAGEQAEPWTVKRAYWAFRQPPGDDGPTIKTCPVTGQEVSLDEWHVRAVATRDRWPSKITSSIEQQTFYFRRVEDYVTWLEDGDAPV